MKPSSRATISSATSTASGWQPTKSQADRPKDGGLYTSAITQKHVRELVEKIAKEQPESRIGALYNSFMDVEKIEADGLEPLLKEIARF